MALQKQYLRVRSSLSQVVLPKLKTHTKSLTCELELKGRRVQNYFVQHVLLLFRFKEERKKDFEEVM